MTPPDRGTEDTTTPRPSGGDDSVGDSHAPGAASSHTPPTMQWTRVPWSSNEEASASGDMTEDPDGRAADQVLDARWEALAPHVETFAKSPRATILPSRVLRTTAGERAFEAAKDAEIPSARLTVSDDVIGVGGMSVVRRGRQTLLDREVAVKELPERRRKTRAAHELLQEAWVTGRLEHPNVVPVYDLALDETGSPRLVMKRIEGVRWTDLIQAPTVVRERFGTTDELQWHLGVFMQVCHAIHFAHQRGVIHRDLKPDNVMIGAFGEVYVLDWGIAITTDDSSVLPAHDAAQMAGTPPYMAPEMLTGEPATVQTDVYLLGGLLYEVITGKPPHHGKNLREIARKALLSQPSLPEDTPPELADIVRTCLSRHMARRYSGAEAVRRAVLRLLERREANAIVDAAFADLERLESLAAELSTPPTAGQDRRSQIYGVFGACRFGFRAAMARLPDSARASQGLVRSVGTMIELELLHDNAPAAAALLAELDNPPDALCQRVRQAEAETTQRRAALESLAFEHDHAVGARTRWWVMVVLTAVWIAVPIYHFWTGAVVRWSAELTRPLFYIALLLVLMLARWSELTANRFNRRLWSAAMTMFALEAVFTYGQQMLGMDPVAASIQDELLRALGIAMLAVFVEPIFWFGAIGFTASYLVSTKVPSARYPMALLANALLMLPILWRWRPGGTITAGDSSVTDRRSQW